MKIPEHLPPSERIENKGDVTRELLANSDLTSTLIVPRNLVRANEKNGIGRIQLAPKKDFYKGFFKSVEAKRLPSGGKAHMSALPVFRNFAKKGGYTGVKHGTEVRKMGK